MNGPQEALRLAREGAALHVLGDQCQCDDCREHYGPSGAPGRCRHCFDAQQGSTCDDAATYAAIIAALEHQPEGGTP